MKAAVENELSKIAIKGVRQNGLLGIRRTVTDGLIQGDSYPKMARKIKKFMDSTASSYQTIVRTEGQRSAVAGQRATYDAAEDLGVEMLRIWDATLDSRTRPAHGRLDGKPSDGKDEIGHYWNVGGQRIHGPHMEGGPAFTINCVPGWTNIVNHTGIEKIYRREYTGKLVTLLTKNGILFSGTPNHPILTDKGWVALDRQ